MKVYQTKEIRNIVVASHQGSGKTSLAEAMLFDAGSTTRLGRITEGNTVSDYRPEETKKGISVNTSLLACEWQGKKLNILDVPGFMDFVGEWECSVPIAETVLLVVDAASGVGVGTELISDMAKDENKACMVFMNKLDRENADFHKLIEDLNTTLERQIIPIHLPIGEEAAFKGVVDVLAQKAYVYEDESGKAKEIAIPADLQAEADALRQSLIEAAAEGDDELIMKFLDGEELTQAEIILGLKQAIIQGTVTPVLCGSAYKNIGVDLLLNFMADYLPSPLDCLPAEDADKPFAAQVFKTITDSFIGKLSYFKVLQGKVKNDTPLYNSTLEKEEKIGGLSTSQGKTQIPVAEVNFGDIGVAAKLPFTCTNQTLTLKEQDIILEPLKFSVPNYTVAIAPKSKNDEDKLGVALNKTLEEDPTLVCIKDAETKQTLLTGLGETHIDIALDRLERKFNVLVDIVERRLPYRETIKAKATKVEGKHKKQSGGHGQFGHVYIDVEPCPDQDFVFEEKIFGGSVPKQYIPAVEKGLKESLVTGVLAGYPVTNIKVTLTDGSYHAVDSSEMAFKIATNQAFKKACEEAKPILLEPIMDVEIHVPDQFTGDIMGDMNSRRGKIMGMEKEGKTQLIKALVPLAELSRYAIDLKSMTQGRGRFFMKFVDYEEAPQIVADKVIADSKKEKEY